MSSASWRPISSEISSCPSWRQSRTTPSNFPLGWPFPVHGKHAHALGYVNWTFALIFQGRYQGGYEHTLPNILSGRCPCVPSYKLYVSAGTSPPLASAGGRLGVHHTAHPGNLLQKPSGVISHTPLTDLEMMFHRVGGHTAQLSPKKYDSLVWMHLVDES